jgi:pimeloyl-ACP methyl ester carboxylesterase
MSDRILLTVPTSFGVVPVQVEQRGEGRAVVILHGGAGPASVTRFADLLAEETGSRVVVPTHPGFGGTQRPEPLETVGQLAELYASMFVELALDDVTLIGNSIGGWIAAEVALLRPADLGRLVLVDAVGIDVPEHPVAGVLSPQQLIEHSWYDTSKAPILDPAALPPEAQQILAANRAALARYGGAMTDPGLMPRLSDVAIPTLVLWGEADRIVDTDYGRAFAAAIPGARFELLPTTGHVPQMETPELLLEALRPFVTGGPTS